MKVKVWKKIYHANINKKKAGVAKLILDKVNFRAKKTTRDKGILHDDKRVNLTRRHVH